VTRRRLSFPGRNRPAAALIAGSLALVAVASCSSSHPAPRGSATATPKVTLGSGSSTTQAAGPLNLPKIPWAGGPAYYAQFPAAAAYGWTSHKFFPITVWDASIDDPSEVAQDKAAGINTYLNPSGADFAAAQAAGMSIIASTDPHPVLGPEVVGYDLTDEPDGWARAGNGPINKQEQQCATSAPCAYTLLSYLDQLAPKSLGRFTYTNFTATVIQQPGIGAHFLRDYQDIVSIDAYYYTDTGPACYTSTVYGLLKPGECPKAADYGMDVAEERALVPDKPVWNYVEVGSTVKGGGLITPAKLGGAVWNSIISGAMGIDYFIEDTGFKACQGVGNLIRDTSCPAAVAATSEIAHVDSQIKDLAPVLNTQSFRYTFNSSLDTMLKYKGGSYYIFAMPGLNGGPGSYTLHLPPGLSASKVDVIDEGRTIPIVNNAFTDSFDQEYTYHIYKITP
jgi:hypothetical protein